MNWVWPSFSILCSFAFSSCAFGGKEGKRGPDMTLKSLNFEGIVRGLIPISFVCFLGVQWGVVGGVVSRKKRIAQHVMLLIPCNHLYPFIAHYPSWRLGLQN